MLGNIANGFETDFRDQFSTTTTKFSKVDFEMWLKTKYACKLFRFRIHVKSMMRNRFIGDNNNFLDIPSTSFNCQLPRLPLALSCHFFLFSYFPRAGICKTIQLPATLKRTYSVSFDYMLSLLSFTYATANKQFYNCAKFYFLLIYISVTTITHNLVPGECQ